MLACAALSACSSPPRDPLAFSHAFDRPGELTRAGDLRALAEEHPGKTGLSVLGSGLDAFAARLLLIERAERAIDAQYYIFHDDLTGRALLGSMLDAARRGVRVRLLIDDLGSWNIDSVLAGAAAHPNLEVRLFNPLARGPWPGLAKVLDLLRRPFRLNHRMHNKLLAVDGVAAVVGGRNVGDEYFDASEGVNFADLDLLAVGPVLGDLAESFDAYWNSPFVASIERWSAFDTTPDALARVSAELAADLRAARQSRYAERVRRGDLVRDVEARSRPLIFAPTRAHSDRPEKIAARGDALRATLLGQHLKPLFLEARTELAIVSPYFIPGTDGSARLCESAARGVRIRILTNSLSATDVAAVHAGYKKYRKRLLACGVELFELKSTGSAMRSRHRTGLLGSSSASLHAKSFVTDRERVFVGSLNLDPRSVDLNTELGLVVESAELAERQLAVFERAISPELSWQLSLDERGRIVWRGSEAGEPREAAREPDTSWFTRLEVALLGLLPIEGQL